uniref:Capsid protein n=1 Tax=Bovine astrovirus B34/HK TaxID=1027246 RepID=F6LD29_9VIRU|nr:capsid protein precursor [Bovine astrovirus B34/HK]
MSSWIVFGGEDQRQILMASRQQNQRAQRNTTNIVVRNGPAAPQGRRQRNGQQTTRRRRRRLQVQAVQTRGMSTSIKNKNFRRVPRSQNINHRVVFQKVTTTLGTVGANASNNIEVELSAVINPAVMKEQTGSNQFGPLTIVASQYSMWKLVRMAVRLKPLVGNNAANGTMIRVSYNPTTGAGQSSWSSLGARKHTDVAIGKEGRFVLTQQDVKGPKGGWFFTNTTNDATSSCGGVVNIHSLGRTTNPYTNNEYTGPLFLVEVDTEWQFKDYLQQPGLLNMIKGDTSEAAKIIVDSATGKIQMEVDRGLRLAESATNPGAAEVIWMVTDTIVQVGTAALPQPFAWLFQGGWWFLKRILNAPVNGATVVFDVFPSMSDAQNDRYIYCDQSNLQPVPIGTVQYQQITPGNTGIASQSFTTNGTTSGQTGYRVDSLKVLYSGEWLPAQPVWVQRKTYTSAPVGIKFKAGSQVVTTFNVFEAQVDAVPPTEGIPVYLQTHQEDRVGLAVAGSHADLADSREVHLTSILFYATASQAYTFDTTNGGAFIRAELNHTAYVQRLTTGSNDISSHRIQIIAGRWYLAQFFCDGTWARAFDIGGIPAYVPESAWTNQQQTYAITSTEGDVNGGFPLGYLARLHLTTFTNMQVTERVRGEEAIQALAATLDLSPDEYYDIPPLEDDDDAEEFTDRDLELHPMDDYDVPPISRCVVHPEVKDVYELLLKTHPEREARLAVNQLKPSDEYSNFTTLYHDALVDGLSPRSARAYALGL